METRAHHLLIGSFMLIMIAGLFAFILWLAKVDIDEEYNEYDIYFSGSVAGLNEAGNVRFNGIPVGQVTAIRIVPEDPSKVRVSVRIQNSVPILEDTVARLEVVGFTGVAYVQIEGGMAGGQPLTAEEDEERPVIPSRPSPIQDVLESAPDFVNQATLAVVSVQRLLSEDNREAVANILANIETLSGGLAEQTDDIQTVLANLDETIADFRETARAFTALANSAEGVVDEDVRLVLADVRALLTSADALTVQLDQVVAENRPALTNFTSGTLPEVSRLVLDARRLAASLSSVAERLEDNPTELIFGTKRPEYQAQ